jgi:YidC/Oxa1 family membrane protein insertase
VKQQINPLSGCLPTLAQIPIFISLYRALLNLAKENALNEPFLWLPSLEGPVFGAAPADSLNWIKVCVYMHRQCCAQTIAFVA